MLPFRSSRKQQERPLYLLNGFALRRQLRRPNVVLVLCTLLYSISVGTYHFTVLTKFGLGSNSSGIISKSCWFSDSSSKIRDGSYQNNWDMEERDKTSTNNDFFRILCTSTRRKMKYGSYQLRCRDLKTWSRKCTKNIHIVTDVSFEDIQRLWWLRNALGQLREEEKLTYNATMFVKSFPERGRLLPLYGNMFVDMVDEYGYSDETIPIEMHLILQTERQGIEVFSSHKYTVVEHWYNSFPADMALSGPPDFVPPISQGSNISIATVWNTKRSEDPSEGGCPTLELKNASYECFDQPFDVSKWYLDLFTEAKDICEMERILANPRLGKGLLYYNVFRKFDALVVLAKNDSMKLEYGNVQRAVSQMRSGVPVLIEIRGSVLEDFVEKYNYTCAFRRHDNGIFKKSSGEVKYMSFQEAVLQLMQPETRKQCQEEAVAIVRDYTPSKIAQNFLRALGYSGDFLC